jgi:16S rRNA A1518/A1519 N6-dimethyltransferase RsmA/KsgA/DIM1 with predicted DNA glycosylase/AP lyase activity
MERSKSAFNMEDKKKIENAKLLTKGYHKFLTFELGPASTSRYLKIAKYITKGRVLDIGCCRGILYLFLKDKKIQYIGLEKDRKLANFANKITGNKVINKDVYKNKLKKNSFDFRARGKSITTS